MPLKNTEIPHCKKRNASLKRSKYKKRNTPRSKNEIPLKNSDIKTKGRAKNSQR